MEGLPYDFGIEDDPDDDDAKERKAQLKKPITLGEIFKSKPETAKEDKTEKNAEDPVEGIKYEEIDTAPELDGEAPLEHLSQPETEAISQTLASERLNEIREVEPTVSNENIAAESFLENVEASGDIDQAYSETLRELGETAVEPNAETPESETAEPPTSEDLREAARSELAPDVYYHISGASNEEAKPPDKAPTPLPAKSKERFNRVQSGIIDYVVGRRHGRLAAEKRHSEVERKLSHEVQSLKAQLTHREDRVREIAQNRTILPPAFELASNKKKEKPLESLGKVLVEAEMPERIASLSKTSSELAGITAHTMRHNELLKVADKIVIEGTSLRTIYESHLVGEKGLRRIIAAHLRGGNVKRVLRRELVEREIDFERDPKLRDQASSLPVYSKQVDLDQLLTRSGIDWSEPQPTIAKPRSAKKTLDLTKLLPDSSMPDNPYRRAADIVMISVIAVLAAVVTVLLLTR